MEKLTIEELAAKLDALKLWNAALPFHWALAPHGTVLPYFVSIVKDNPPVKIRVLLLEGWQTFHDFVRASVDRNFGFCSSPTEFAHYELVILTTGDVKLFRYDPGYVPAEVTDGRQGLCLRMLWEVYGVMMRLEGEPKLPLKFSDDKALFARKEDAAGNWTDLPLPIPEPRAQVESVSLAKDMLAKAKELPFDANLAVEADLHLLSSRHTREPRPRFAYELLAVDANAGEVIVSVCTSVTPEFGLRGIWEGMPAQLLAGLVKYGRIPGEIRVASGRMFRLLRPLGMELPFKISLHDKLPRCQPQA